MRQRQLLQPVLLQRRRVAVQRQLLPLPQRQSRRQLLLQHLIVRDIRSAFLTVTIENGSTESKCKNVCYVVFSRFPCIHSRWYSVEGSLSNIFFVFFVFFSN